MADNKKMTRYEFMVWANNRATDTGDSAIMEAAAAALEAEEKKRNRAKNAPKTESKEKRLNRAKCLEIMRAIVDAGNEPRTAAWIGEHVDYVETSHKVTGKMNIGRTAGWIEYGDKDHGKTTWRVTDAGIAALDHPTE